jgi:IS1 family transposase/transposase-like protein
MTTITISVQCPHCSSTKVVKNGRKSNGEQNYLCKSCKKQFLWNYHNRGADPTTRRLIFNMLTNNSGIRDISRVLGISTSTVLAFLLRESRKTLTPKLQQYKSVQIDELWTFVHRRKKGKYWLIYAYSPETKEVLAFVSGTRSAKTVQRLYDKLRSLEIEEFCTDNWNAFVKVLPKEKHRIGKEYTKHIEGVNTSLRAKNRRLVRRTTAFSKKKLYHIAALVLMFYDRNKYHTF